LRFELDSGAVRLRSCCLELAVLFSVIFSIHAQEPLPTIRSESNVVLVPTLVRTKAGEITYSLQAKDFIVEDNGVQQDVTLDESPEQEPVSLVVAIQVGHKASSQFKKRNDLSLYDRFYSEEQRKDCRKRIVPCPTAIAGLGTMLSDFMDQTKGEVALVTFDGLVYLFQGFTEDASKISERLTKLTPGDDGAAILDAVSYSARLLESRPRNRRRVLLLISESRDHGSMTTTALNLVQQLAASNTLVCSLLSRRCEGGLGKT
jgi:von Willebrand factor type A domain